MYRKNVAGQFIYFAMVTTAGVADAAATVTCKRCIDGGAQATATGTTTHRGSGQYEFALSQADTNGNNISYFFTATGDVPVEKTIVTTAADPTDAVRFGLTALPNAAAEAAGGLYTRGSGAGQINQPANGLVDVNTLRWNGTAVSAPATAGIPDVNVKNMNNVPATSITTIKAVQGLATDGVVPTVTNLTNAPTAGDLTATMKTSVTTAATAATPSAASVTGNVGGNVTGSVGSVVGAVGSVTGAVGSVTGAVGSVTAAVAVTSNVKKNQALAKFQFLMTDSTLHAPKTGLTVSVTRSIDGAAYAAGTLANVAEVGNGMYTVDFGAGDVNGNVVVLQATAALADTTFERLVTQP